MKLIRQANKDNFRDVEREWQWEFVFYVLSNMGIPDEELEQCVPEDHNYLNIETKHRIALRNFMNKRDVTIVNDNDGGLKIYVYIGDLEEHVLVAEWKKCKFLYKEDPKEIDPNNKLYVEVQADVWTSFGEENE